MEFEVCDKDEKKVQFFFISSVLVAANGDELEMSNKTIDFDKVFFGHPILKNLTDKGYSFRRKKTFSLFHLI